MCKQRAVSVCPTSGQRAAELRTCAQLFSLGCQWASPGWACPKGLCWEACTQSDIWTTQEGGITPFFLPHCLSFLSHSLCNSHSLSFLFLHPSTEGSSGHSHLGKDDEHLYTWASWLFSSRAVPLVPFILSSPSLSPFFPSNVHLSVTPGWQGCRGRELRDDLTCAVWEESRSERWHITTTFRSLISPWCHNMLISRMKKHHPLIHTHHSYIVYCTPPLWNVLSYYIKLRTSFNCTKEVHNNNSVVSICGG